MEQTQELPLLNRPDYVPCHLRTIEDDALQYYNIHFSPSDKSHMRTQCSPQKFDAIYEQILVHFTQIERLEYQAYLKGEKPEKELFQDVNNYAQQHYSELANSNNDRGIMIARVAQAIFSYDFITPLIENEEISDIKICSPKDIRVRVKGKALLSNITFFDDNDLYRFIEGLSIRNHVDILSRPIITFTDKGHPDFILRFVVTSPIISADGIPTIHIRKISRKKPDFTELNKRKMLTMDVADYAIEKAKTARTITIAGPPGSGKTQFLNALIEYIPRWRETLVIQENEELYTEQSGFIFEHVTYGFKGEASVGLEELGIQALVQGCNEFIIGEVKGAEMRSAATLIQTGGYSMWTCHSDSARDVLPRCAALIKEGSSYSLDEACNRLKDCEVIIYMSEYKVREILECTGYNKDTHEFTYREIYKRELDPKAAELDA